VKDSACSIRGSLITLLCIGCHNFRFSGTHCTYLEDICLPENINTIYQSVI
jgi:hypothetical protein